MQLTGIIIFVAALFGLLLWLYRLLLELASLDFYVQRVTVNILPGVILFIAMAISAGMI